jgi:glutaryl-CoA dehydrogenase
MRAIMEGAQETQSPVIVQASAGARKYAGANFLRHLMLAAVEEFPDIPVVMHQDHGASADVCQRSMQMGFTSVMMDGSLLEDQKTPAEYEYNVAVTRRVVEMWIGCFGLTEPDYGSNPGDMITKAEDMGDHYLLNGAKMWITNGTIADVAVVWAKLDGVIRGFIVEKGDEGFSAPEMKGKHSLKASVTSELVFQDCKIPKDRMLPGVKGLRGPFSCLNNARFGISWGALGAAMACFHSAKTYSLSRIQFDHPIASYQLVQNKLAWMLREITKGQLLAYHLGRKKDDGTWFNEQISLAKMNNVDIALEIARVARDIHGANGVLDEYPVMRHMANLESVKTYEGTHDIHNLIIGRYITGIQAFTRSV